MNPTFRPVFNPKNRFRKDNTAPVVIVITLARQRAFIPTKVFLKSGQWDDAHGKVKTNNARYLVHNAIISNLISQLDDYLLDLIRHKEPITLDKLRNFIKAKPAKKPVTFNQFYQDEINNDRSLQPSTIKDHKKSLAKLNEFNPAIGFDDISFSLVHDYNNFLFNKGLSVNTVWNIHKTFKKYLNLAANKGYYDIRNNPYKSFKVDREPSHRVVLDFDEIERIENLEYSIENYQISKDIFLFACYTGLRSSDLIQLNTSHIQYTEQGINIELHKMIKTRFPVNLPLYLLYNGKPQKILEKFLDETKGNQMQQNVKSIFQPYWVLRTNEDIKKIARDAGINKSLSLQCARHSFGTNTMELTGDIQLVGDLMGHRKLETTMIYQHMSQERMNRRLQNITWQPGKLKTV